MTIKPDIRVDSDIPPTFSVVIPYFNNSESQLNCAIGSVVEKSNIDCVIEVILVNDGGSKLDFSGWMSDLPYGGGKVRFTLIEHSTNKGLAEARNSGIRAAKGAWTIFLDADDWFLKDGMAQIAKFVQSESNADIIYLPSVFSNSLEEEWVSIASELKIMRAATQRVPISASEHPLAETLSSWSLAYRSSFIKRIGIEFDPRLKRWEDRPFYLKALLSANSIAIMPDPVRAYFVGTLGGPRITAKELNFADTEMMSLHIDLVSDLLDAKLNKQNANFCEAHEWYSLKRLFAVALVGSLRTFWAEASTRDRILTAISTQLNRLSEHCQPAANSTHKARFKYLTNCVSIRVLILVTKTRFSCIFFYLIGLALKKRRQIKNKA